MPRHIIINGKFLRAEMTGVHRVAYELTNALADLKAQDHPAVRDIRLELWLPWDGTKNVADIRLPTRVIRYLTGIPWEQLNLGLRARDGLLLNLCNIGPIISRNAVTMIHDVQVHSSPRSYSMPFRLWYHFTQPILCRRHHRIVTISRFAKAEIARVGLCPVERLGVVPNGVDHVLRASPEPEVLARLKLEPRDFVVALATTQAHKNIGLLLEAFHDPTLAGLKLVLFGGHDAAAFEDKGHRLPRNVVFAGRVTDGELRALMEAALCLAFPSTTEGFGLPPLEAMLLGCPAIVAPCGALPEVCGEAAIYADPACPEAWVNAIFALATDNERRERIIAASRAHAQRFTWKRSALTLLKEIENTAVTLP